MPPPCDSKPRKGPGLLVPGIMEFVTGYSYELKRVGQIASSLLNDVSQGTLLDTNDLKEIGTSCPSATKSEA